ncbi:hypothetical protein PFICI_14011 [Pestalotiopsis fici W106-1]|uniref:Zn(2)-C6 fungal-type domain-containing protein n=1 Tax=Pestalotiopsis fici (strain W106-1 / CGMCC3.15140) TaxID=1229662 RepID=W3WJP4_PESFW|nr:uncharacterized protein PFICI_14011 [Pestalotiopsis fici W106-1]ETS74145.1 hypothetical protein PFICI_14011 [Pestalotiopsis fici W106-1]
MKPRSGCESCRERHRKCYFPPGATVCHGCKEANRECRAAPRWTFLAASSSHADSPSTPEDAPLPRRSRPRKLQAVGNSRAQSCSKGRRGAPEAAAQRHVHASVVDFAEDNHVSTVLQHGSSRGARPISKSRVEGAAIEPASAPAIVDTRLTSREAFLLRLYMLKLAPSVDACDESRHFTLIVPRLALEEPMILNGLLALASKYDALSNGRVSDLETTRYHGRCIELLIKAFDRPPSTYDAVLLVAVVISRLYEEYDNDIDVEYHHLRGARSLIDHESVARSAVQGGLAEAASWVHLRQAIYVSLTMQRPLEMSLNIFESVSMLRRLDDTACANRIVYIFAKILQCLCTPSSRPQDNINASRYPQPDSMQLLRDELDTWFATKPVIFEPLFRAETTDTESDVFPPLWLLLPIPVVALQYYYAGKILFCLYDHSGIAAGQPLSSYHAHSDVQAQDAIAKLLDTLMGLAMSNDHVINAFFIPTHMLTICMSSI